MKFDGALTILRACGGNCDTALGDVAGRLQRARSVEARKHWRSAATALRKIRDARRRTERAATLAAQKRETAARKRAKQNTPEARAKLAALRATQQTAAQQERDRRRANRELMVAEAREVAPVMLDAYRAQCAILASRHADREAFVAEGLDLNTSDQLDQFILSGPGASDMAAELYARFEVECPAPAMPYDLMLARHKHHLHNESVVAMGHPTDGSTRYDLARFVDLAWRVQELALVGYKLDHPRARGDALWIHRPHPEAHPTDKKRTQLHCRICGALLVADATFGQTFDYKSDVTDHALVCALEYLSGIRTALPPAAVHATQDGQAIEIDDEQEQGE